MSDKPLETWLRQSNAGLKISKPTNRSNVKSQIKAAKLGPKMRWLQPNQKRLKVKIFNKKNSLFFSQEKHLRFNDFFESRIESAPIQNFSH